jgi:ADP-ribose pyrophosphatase YjhB (NUDIX family)
VRELREEIGIEVDEMDLLGIYGDPTLTMTDRPIAQGYRARFIVACFLVRSFRGQISADPKEVDAWDWFSPDTLPEPMIRSHPVRVRDAVRYRGEVFVR